jgi:predicted Rossmann fold flavoprotein
MKQNEKVLLVIGGGAAGFFCAINAARLAPNLRVILAEKTGKYLQKVKVSGGGRCNTTHHLFEIAPLTKKYPRGEKFLKKAFHHFGPAETVTWFAERGVKLKTEDDGRMFPVTDSSQTIIDCLVREATKYGVELWPHTTIASLSAKGKEWVAGISGGKEVEATYVCIATGGFPKLQQYEWLIKDTGHTIEPPLPSLFTFNTPGHSITKLMGVSHHASIKIAGLPVQSEGPVLITHWGLSGPAVLKASAFAARYLAMKDYVFDVIINWMPTFNENSLRDKILVYRQEMGSKKIINTEWVTLPARLFKFLLQCSDIAEDQRWADLAAAKQNRLINSLCAFSISAKGKTTFKEEFVTAGGINLGEIDPNTMQSRLHAGLYFAGEIMDVDGITGGFNFQHAWTSGMLSANHISASVL